MKKNALYLSALALAAGLSGAAWAQSSPAQGGNTGHAPTARANLPDSSDISDQEVTQFAQARKKVQAIKTEYRQKAQAQSQKPKKAMDVQREAQQKMVKAVKDTGLKVRKYNQIARVAQYDTDLRKRIKDLQ